MAHITIMSEKWNQAVLLSGFGIAGVLNSKVYEEKHIYQSVKFSFILKWQSLPVSTEGIA